jgi:hypothetical protein
MTVPVICFTVGILPLILAFGYGRLGLQAVPDGFLRRDFWIYAVGYSLVAIALMSGLLGYLGHLNSEILRPIRLVVGILGLILLGYQYIEITARL